MNDEQSTAGPSTNETAKREGGCTAEWGNCDRERPEKMAYFGKPSLTPHRCSGVRRHTSKLHLCENCGFVGSRIQPVAGSKACRQLVDLTLRAAKDRVKAKFAELATRIDQEQERAKNIATTNAVAEALADMEA